jgi:hypothetical protein
MEETTKTVETQEIQNPDPKNEEPKKENKLARAWSKTKSGATKVWTKVKKPVTVVLAIGAAIVGAAIVGDAIESKQNPIELPEGSFTDIPEKTNTEATETEAAEE